jgi:hypothetical protein
METGIFNNEAADVTFIAFALVFFVSRNIVFPFFVIMSVHRYGYYENGVPVPTHFFSALFKIALWTLEVLHVYWASQIGRMIYIAIRENGVQDDIRHKPVKHD